MSLVESIATAAGVTFGAATLAKLIDNRAGILNDLFMAKAAVLAKLKSNRVLRNKETVADFWEQTVDRHPHKSAIIYEGKHYTFGEIDEAANQLAHWFIREGYSSEDTAALFMTNRPEFLITWLGCAKIGMKAAFVNFNLKGEPLLHCLKISHAKLVLFDGPLVGDIEDIRDRAAKDLRTCCYGDILKPGAGSDKPPFTPHTDLTTEVKGLSTARVSRDTRAKVDPVGTFAYIYTSGTTGLPKAAVISHVRMMVAGLGFAERYGIYASDRIYTVLPLYHSAGGMIGIGLVMYTGCTMVLRNKFSLRSFWDDCANHKVTVIQYIGELCRYLLSAPAHPRERLHNVRIAIGNGLRPDIWADFQTRFNIPEIGEFYGSTEGNAVLMNHCTDKQSQGAVGRLGVLIRSVGIMPIVKYDDDAERPMKSASGFLTECGPGETGELLGKIEDDPVRKFQGYHGNKKATNDKIITDAFRKGDKYFRTGDLLKRDSRGYYYFMDRIGDTFRWKGENVATTEVAEVLSKIPGVSEVNVYGVVVPGLDGQAGMAAIVPDDKDAFIASLDSFAEYARKNLPVYAVPIFVRLLPKVPITSTFKHQKVALRKEGVNPTVVTDPVYVMDASTKKYKLLDAAAYEIVTTGQSKL